MDLKDNGKFQYGTCPFCKSSATTLIVMPDGKYFCLACGRSGEVKKDLSDPVPTGEKSRLYRLNAAACELFHNNLYGKYGERGLSYLKGRQLTDETIRRFRLGYAGGYRFPIADRLKDRGFTDDELIASGLFARTDSGSLWFRFHNRVMFPILDVKNRVISFGGRVLEGDDEPKYKNGPETEIFSKRENLYAFEKAIRSRKNWLVLCEGYMDVISMHQAGFTNAVASLGTALTPAQASLIREYAPSVIVLYDTDTAGQNATKKAIRILKEAGLAAFVQDASPCKDPDEFIRSIGAESFRKKLRNPMSAQLYSCRMARDDDGNTNFQEVLSILLENFEEKKVKSIVTAIAKEES